MQSKIADGVLWLGIDLETANGHLSKSGLSRTIYKTQGAGEKLPNGMVAQVNCYQPLPEGELSEQALAFKAAKRQAAKEAREFQKELVAKYTAELNS